MTNTTSTTSYSTLESSFTSFPIDRLHDSLHIDVFSAGPPRYLFEVRSDYDHEDQHKQEPEFMYAQILKEILIKMQLTEEKRLEMFDFFERKIFGSTTQLNLLESFKKECSAETAICWYTRDAFVYRYLNEALRAQNVSNLCCTQYFIRLLHDQITKLHADQQSKLLADGTTLMKVFRGLSMSDADFETLKTKGKDDYLSINSFLSTTLDEEKAKDFATSTLHIDGMASLLFEMEIDVARCQTPFANVENHSVFSHEKEVLFTMGAVFIIQSVDRDSDGFWKIRLKLDGRKDRKLLTLMEHLGRDVHKLTPIFQLGRLMEKRGDFDEAIRFYRKLLPDGESPIKEPYGDVAAVFANLGSCYAAKNNIEEAICYFTQAIQIVATEGGEHHIDLSSFYINLALIYKEQGDEAGRSKIEKKKERLYSEALNLLLKALHITGLPQYEGKYPERRATIYHNLGFIYDDEKKFPKALEMYKKALEICEKVIPDTHPDLGYLYNNIAQVYQSLWDEYRSTENIHLSPDFFEQTMKHFDQTIPDFKKANKILRSSLAADHPELAVSCNNISMAYYYSGQLEEAVAEMEKAVTIYSYPKNRPAHAAELKRLEELLVDMKKQLRGRELERIS